MENIKKDKQKNKLLRGFTIIELIVVISIIAVLAAIVTTNVIGYIGRAKLTRANADAQNIAEALSLFYSQYGAYPHNPTNSNYDSNPTNYYMSFYPIAAGGFGDPYLAAQYSPDGQDHHLSEFYKLDWTGYNASYFVPNGYYMVGLYPSFGGEINCAAIMLVSPGDSSGWNFYGTENISLTPNYACSQPYPFQTTPYTF